MNIQRLFLTTMAGPNEAENLREIIEPLRPYLDGVVAVIHDAADDDSGVQYLESVKGAGKVIRRPFVYRHQVSMNETLYAGVIQEGDLVIWTDLLERPAAQFVSRINGDVLAFMNEHSIQTIYYYGKAYVFRYEESMRYEGSPHWYLVNAGTAIDFANIYPDEGKVRLNVRPWKRTGPEHHWALHYGRYWLYPAGSNHALLGLEKQGDPSVLFPIREARRLEFRREMRRRGCPMTMEGLKALLCGPLDDGLREHLRSEKTLSDLWHFWHGNAEALKDTHLPSDAIPIP